MSQTTDRRTQHCSCSWSRLCLNPALTLTCRAEKSLAYLEQRQRS